ncbi:hypothetical protein STEG23_035965 [Scotinomys teguina]
MEKKEWGLPEDPLFCGITLVAFDLWEVGCVVDCRPSGRNLVGSASALVAFNAFLTKGSGHETGHGYHTPGHTPNYYLLQARFCVLKIPQPTRTATRHYSDTWMTGSSMQAYLRLKEQQAYVTSVLEHNGPAVSRQALAGRKSSTEQLRYKELGLAVMASQFVERWWGRQKLDDRFCFWAKPSIQYFAAAWGARIFPQDGGNQGAAVGSKVSLVVPSASLGSPPPKSLGIHCSFRLECSPGRNLDEDFPKEPHRAGSLILDLEASRTEEVIRFSYTTPTYSTYLPAHMAMAIHSY